MTEINDLDIEMGRIVDDSSFLLGMAEVWFKHREVSSLNLFYLNMFINEGKRNFEPLTMTNYASYVRACEFPDDDDYTYSPCDFDAVVKCNESGYGKKPAVWGNYEKALSMIKLNYVDVIDDNQLAVNGISLSLVNNPNDEYEVGRLRDLVAACIVYLDIDLNFNIETVREAVTNWALNIKKMDSIATTKSVLNRK